MTSSAVDTNAPTVRAFLTSLVFNCLSSNSRGAAHAAVKLNDGILISRRKESLKLLGIDRSDGHGENRPVPVP